MVVVALRNASGIGPKVIWVVCSFSVIFIYLFFSLEGLYERLKVEG